MAVNDGRAVAVFFTDANKIRILINSMLIILPIKIGWLRKESVLRSAEFCGIR